MSHLPPTVNAGTYQKVWKKAFPNEATAILKAIGQGSSKAQICRERGGKGGLIEEPQIVAWIITLKQTGGHSQGDKT